MRKIIFVLLLLGSLVSYGQSAVLCAGDTKQDVGGSVSYSVGQVATSATANSNVAITEGVQQTYSTETTSIADVLNNACLVSIYPNPTSGRVYICAETANTLINFSIYNSSGQLIISQCSSDSYVVDLKNQPAGCYILRASDNWGNENVFKIIKR